MGTTLRLATPADYPLLTEWLQHPDTRRYSRRARPLTAEELDERLRAENWIIEHDHVPSGAVRFDHLRGEREVSIFMAPEMKRRGIATAALRLLAGPLVAEVKAENAASAALFSRAGFHLCDDGLWRNH